MLLLLQALLAKMVYSLTVYELKPDIHCMVHLDGPYILSVRLDGLATWYVWVSGTHYLYKQAVSVAHLFGYKKCASLNGPFRRPV